MYGKPINRLLAALSLAGGVAQAQEQAFNVYGFADASFSQSSIERNNFLYFFTNNDPQWTLDHFNVYFDYKPNAMTRSLLEIGFIDERTLEAGNFADQIITTNFSGIPDALVPVLAANGFTATRVDTGLGTPAKSTNIPIIERAYFDLLLDAKANLRFGRFITPAGIWNVDHGSPVILTVVQPYQTSLLPIFPIRQDGIMLYGNGFFGDHDYDYSFYVSTGSSDDQNDLKDLGYLSAGTHLGTRLDLPVKIKLGFSGYSGVTRKTHAVGYSERTVPYSAVSTLDTNLGAPLPDVNKLMAVLSQPPVFSDVYYVDQVVRQERHTTWGLDARFDYRAAFLQAEVNQRVTANELKGDRESMVLGYYLVLGYKIPVKDWLSATPYGMYESISWEDVLNTQATSTFGPLPMSGFDRFLGGVNFGLLGNVYVKVEYSYGMMRDIGKPPAIPSMTVNYEDGATDIGTFSTQFAIAF